MPWWRRDDSSTKGLSRTSPTASWEVDLDNAGADPGAFLRALDEIAGHCSRAAQSADAGGRSYGTTGAALVCRVRDALASTDTSGLGLAALALGLHLREWQVKDTAEPEFVRGVEDLARRRRGGIRAARVRVKERERERQGWLQMNAKLDQTLSRAARARWIFGKLGKLAGDWPKTPRPIQDFLARNHK